MKIMFQILIISIMILISYQMISIPFKVKEKKTLTSENLMSQLIENEIYIETKVGTPTQNIPLYLKLNEFPTFITSSSYNKNIPSFDQSKSTTYILKEHYESEYSLYDFIKGKLSSDTLNLIDSQKKNIQLNDFHFFLAYVLKEGKEEMSGEIGLKLIELYGNQKTDFMKILKERNLTEHMVFSILYNDDNKGIFYLGNYYHNFDGNYNEKDLKKMNVGLRSSNEVQWQLNFDKIIVQNQTLMKPHEVDLSYEFGLILGDKNYYNKIYELYFNDYKNECVEKKFNNDIYFYIECSTDINIKKFPELSFLNNDLNYTFSFNGKELFYKFKGKYYFQIIFQSEHTKRWKFGKLFFKKYQIFFDKDKKIISLYPYTIAKSNFTFSWFLVLILFAIIIGILIYIRLYLTYKKRKIRANELEDEFDYTSQSNVNDNNKNKLLGI